MIHTARVYCTQTKILHSFSGIVPKVDALMKHEIQVIERQGILTKLSTLGNTSDFYIVKEIYDELTQAIDICDDDIRFKVMQAMYRHQKKKPNLIDDKLGFINWAELATFMFTSDKASHDPLQLGRRLFKNLSMFQTQLNGYKKPRLAGTREGANLRSAIIDNRNKERNSEILRAWQHGPKNRHLPLVCALTGTKLEGIQFDSYDDELNDVDYHHLNFLENQSSNKSNTEPSNIMTSVMTESNVFELMSCLPLSHISHKLIHKRFKQGQDIRFWQRVWASGRGVPQFGLVSEDNYNEFVHYLETECGYYGFLRKYSYSKMLESLHASDEDYQVFRKPIDEWLDKRGI